MENMKLNVPPPPLELRTSMGWHGNKVVKKFAVIFPSILLAISIALFSVTNVPTDVTLKDAAILNNVLRLDMQSMRHQSFDDELTLIRDAQQKILQMSPTFKGIPEFETRELSDLHRLKSGMCYDRSRSIDKALKFLGFQSRHIYLLYGEGKSFLPALFTYRQPSHAVTEAKTSRGWILVDSNSAWISLAKDGTPIPADRVWQSAAEFSTVPGYFQRPFWAIRGLYSRNGRHYPPYLPFPDVNWLDFLTALVE